MAPMKRACIAHALGVRLAAEEAPTTLLVREAGTELLERSRDLARPSETREGVTGGLGADVHIPGENVTANLA